MVAMKKKIIGGLAIATAVLTVMAWFFYMPTYKAQSLVKNSLIDPESASFSEVTHVRKTGAVCGFVNGKNKMGGYVGKKRFFVTSEGKVEIEPTRSKAKPEFQTPSFGGDPFADKSRLNSAVDRYKGEHGAYVAELKEQLAYLDRAEKNCEPK